MNDKILLSNQAVTTTEDLDSLVNRGVAEPVSWSYDNDREELYMTLRNGLKTTALVSKAILGEDHGLYRVATLENSREILLWNSRKVGLRA